MTLEEFKKILSEDPSLQQKFKEAKKTIKSNDQKEKAIALSKIIKDLGYTVPMDEISLQFITSKPLDDNELEAVNGGCCQPFEMDNCYDAHQAADEGRCLFDYVDTDCWWADYCDGIIKKYD